MKESVDLAEPTAGSLSLADDPDFARAFMAFCGNVGMETAMGLDFAIARQSGAKLWAEFFSMELEGVPGMRELIEQRYMLRPSYNLQALARCAPGTLGHTYAQHMVENRLNPDYFPPFVPEDDGSYFKLRALYTHDIWHVVTGYETDHVGEGGLQGFYHGQGPFTVQTFLATATMMHFAMREPQKLRLGWETFVVGWNRGRAAASLWPVRWEEMWDRPLEEIRRELKIPPL
jgi:ubiquinone biosynthesis protein COQ4